MVENGDESGLSTQCNKKSSLGGASPLTAVQQAVILAQCLLIEKSTRQDELQSKLLIYVASDPWSESFDEMSLAWSHFDCF